MKILIVARYKERGYTPFVQEQVEALEKAGLECRFFPVRSRGVLGYLRHLPDLRHAISEFKPDIVHAHYGLCGLLSNLQRKVPVITTYHGSDINNPKILRLSRLAIRHSAYNIFVSSKNIETACPGNNHALIPCGINLEDYPITDKVVARNQMGLEPSGKYVLFAGAYDNPVKDPDLAKTAVGYLTGVRLLELKGYSRQQVALLMQAVDAILMTSRSEGSPQVIKEAMACGCPVVSVDEGDVRERIGGIDGCFVADTRDPEELAGLIGKALAFTGRTDGRDRIIASGLDNNSVAVELKKIYMISQKR